MAHGSLREFDPKKKPVEDFHEHFEFYCVANGIHDDNTVKKKAMFITLLGQENFAKLKVLASPTTMNNLTLDAIVQLLNQHICPATIEIAEWFKLFKWKQKEDESTTEYMGQRSCEDLAERTILARTWRQYFGTNLSPVWVMSSVRGTCYVTLP